MIALLIAAALSAQDLGVDPKLAAALALTEHDHAPGSCHFRIAKNGMRLPDPSCTPGAVNPSVTVEVLNDTRWRTGMVRDKITSEAQKEIVYSWYGVDKPTGNSGAMQTCELDHLVDIGAGGADSLENIWPQCQPEDKPVPIGQREFKIKDRFAEHAVVRQAKQTADLYSLQRRIADDWTQFIEGEGQ